MYNHTMYPSLDSDFIRALPKTDLHVHLDGSLRLSTLIELARTHGIDLPSNTEAGLRELVFRESYADLAEYLRGFSYTCAVLQDPEALERCAFELAEDAFSEGIRYLEVRYAPQLHEREGMTTTDTLRAVARGLARAEHDFNRVPKVAEGEEPPFRSSIIVCAMRMFASGFSDYYRRYLDLHRHRAVREVIAQASVDLAYAAIHARDDLGLPVVGFDLAGQEAGYPASAHVEAYHLCQKHFLKKTVHAGEAFGPESIFQAITDLHADRIGHGYHLFSPKKVTDSEIENPDAYVAGLAQYVADRRITIEVCLSSNLQTNPEIGRLEDHNFGRMLDSNLSTTLCTDNRLVSNTTMCREIQRAVQAFSITPRALKNLVVYGFKRSFFPGSYREKRAYVRQIIDHYERREREFGVAAAQTPSSSNEG